MNSYESSYEELYKNICRVCLTFDKSENMVCLIDNNSEDGLSCYGKAVLTFSNVSLLKDDEFPHLMCQNCLKLLKQAIYFKLKCESSAKNLLHLFKMQKNNNTNLIENIVQFSLFRQYFPQESCPKCSSCSSEPKIVDTNDQSVKNSMDNCVNSCFEEDNVEDDIPEKSGNDSADELLDRIEQIVGQYPSMYNHDYKEHLQHRAVKRTKLQTKRTLMIQKQIQRRKMHYRQVSKQSYVCKICHKVLANSHTYKYHMQRHNGCKYICEHCGKGFPVFVELQMHQVARHGTGPYLQCPHCTFKAPRKHNLIEHIRIHTGERPYTCDKCGLTFRRSAIWKKHMIYHTEKSVQCPHCPKKFFRRSEMLAHANSLHERIYVYLCHKCDATYAKTETVRRHLVERHGIPREAQGKIMRINKGRGAVFPEQ